MRESRVATGFSNIGQFEEMSMGGKTDKTIIPQRPHLSPPTDPAGPNGLGQNQVEAQCSQSHTAQVLVEGGRILRSKGIDICLNEQKQVNVARSESLGQNKRSQKKLPKETKTLVNRGKENEPPAGEVEIQQPAGQNGAKLGTWKRLRRDRAEVTHHSDNGSESGTKRKGSAPLKVLQEETESWKRSKKENEAGLEGHPWAEHMGSTEAAAQPRRHQ